MNMWDGMVYAKWDGCKSFGAFSLSKGCHVGQVYASLVKDTPQVRKSLQEWADKNKDINLVAQIRSGNKILFQTSVNN